MDRTLMQRGAMAALGAVAGLCLYTLSELLQRDLLQDRFALFLAAFGAVFFFALLAMAGPVSFLRSVAAAFALGLVVAGLLLWASFRFDEVQQMFNSPLPVFAAMILATIPLPFVMAFDGPGWRDYPSLFTESWGVAVRYAAAWIFVGAAWALLFLSDALFGILGLHFIGDLIELDPVPWILTGAVLGLGLAVVTELSELISPYLLLRLLRLLLPVVLLVMAVFVVALPVQGVAGLFGGLSVAAVLLAIVGAAATLVTVAVDQSDDEAVQGRWMPAATRAMAALMPVFAGLAAWAVWLRIDQYGWTPTRLFATLASLVALGYGGIYFGAILSPKGWKARIRGGNIAMALVFLVLAAAWLSVLNPQSISARNQLARFQQGDVAVADLDVRAFQNWGRAGGAALEVLAEQAKSPGQSALALRLAGREPAPEDQRAGLLRLLPVWPESEGAMRDRIVGEMPDWLVSAALQGCRASLTDGLPGCILTVADFWTDVAGDEAVLLLRDRGGSLLTHGFGSDGASMVLRPVTSVPDVHQGGTDAESAIRAVRQGVAVIAPVPRNSLIINGLNLTVQP